MQRLLIILVLVVLALGIGCGDAANPITSHDGDNGEGGFDCEAFCEFTRSCIYPGKTEYVFDCIDECESDLRNVSSGSIWDCYHDEGITNDCEELKECT